MEAAKAAERGSLALMTAVAAGRWKWRVIFATADQGCVSAANFLVTILYASWLPLDVFGRFVLVWTIALLIDAFQVSLIMDPLPAIASRHGRTNRNRLEAAATWVVLIYATATSAIVFASIALVAVWFPAYAVPLVCLALINPLQRAYLFLRRLSYIRDRQSAAAASSLAYGLTLTVGAIGLFQLDALSVQNMILLWGVANAAAVLTLCGLGVARLPRTTLAAVAWLAARLWSSGRWLAGAAVTYWITQWGIFPLVAVLGGSEAAGVLRALHTLFTPIVQFNVALNLTLLPRIADRIADQGQRFARAFALYGTLGFTTIVALYAGTVLYFSEPILTLAYGKPEINAAAYLLWPLAAAVVLEAARQACSMALVGSARTRTIFVARFFGFAVFVFGALIFGWLTGVNGVLWASVVSHAFIAALLLSRYVAAPQEPPLRSKPTPA